MLLARTKKPIGADRIDETRNDFRESGNGGLGFGLHGASDRAGFGAKFGNKRASILSGGIESSVGDFVLDFFKVFIELAEDVVDVVGLVEDERHFAESHF